MRVRSSSPVVSENEFDIGQSLFGAGQETADVEDDALQEDGRTASLGNGDLKMLNIMSDGSDDDETAIARHQASSNRKSSNLKGRTVKKGGGFQSMGLNANLLKAITRKGFSVPTPIQRKTIPLLLNEKDVVGMARTGSGKTAAFLIPMIEKLKIHSTQVGARALILSPSRELALQTLQVCKDLARGTDLRTILLVGGDGLEDQFGAMSNNPDIIIATPGRFVHLKVEMGLDLSSVRYAVFDEADRLFEMGFEAQLTEILYALPASRQTLLFSATLPKSLVEFARAGLQDPVLVRLDTESKISPDLQSAFLTVRSSEKEGALLHILQDIIHVPTNSQLVPSSDQSSQTTKQSKKRKRSETEDVNGFRSSDPFSTIVFAATKHHVEYLSQLLTKAGYVVSHVYGSLDQTARKQQVQAFRSGKANILVVTDVAARGIDIPVLANVINYDFPSQPKIFVHRVGRTARAGQKGWSYSIVHDADAPYLLDLQLFLSRNLIVGRAGAEEADFAKDIVVGALQRENLQSCCEWVNQTLDRDIDISALRSVATKGEKLYQKTRNSASTESAKRAKSLVASHGWNELHALFIGDAGDMEVERNKMLAKIGWFRPEESIFEIGARRGGRKGNEEAIDAMRKIRSSLEVKKKKSQVKTIRDAANSATLDDEQAEDSVGLSDGEDEVEIRNPRVELSEASESELEVTFSNSKHKPKRGNSLKTDLSTQTFDPEDPMAQYRSADFMSYIPANTNAAEDRAYGIASGSANNAATSNFTEAARKATMDLAGDETGGKTFGESRQVMRWDKRHKKYVRQTNDEDGSKANGGGRLVRGESGAKIAASFKSGRYDAWRKANRIARAPRVGETENTSGETNHDAGSLGERGGGKRFKHKKITAAKAPDKYRDDFEKKRKKVREAREQANEMGLGADQRSKMTSRHGGAAKSGKVTNTVDDIRKQRNLKEKRREKNARPSKKGRTKK